jgi:DNA invertase Pin-like site-specific DNA recombinase
MTICPTRQLLLHILTVVAQFERELIRERVSARMRAAKKHGTETRKCCWTRLDSSAPIDKRRGTGGARQRQDAGRYHRRRLNEQLDLAA